MRLRIAHSIVRRYDPPAAGAIQVLRLTPRNHDGQYVIGWRIDVSTDARLNAHEDAFGNLTHVFTADGPLETLSINVDGEVETQNTEGVVRGTVERFPPSLFLRDTPLTQADERIREFAGETRPADGNDVLAHLHALMHRLHEETAPRSRRAARSCNGGGGFCAQARRRPRPDAYLYRRGAQLRDPGALHRRISLRRERRSSSTAVTLGRKRLCPDLGWVGFDAVNCVCPTEAYVRVAVGLDALGAVPVRGTRYGAGDEKLAVAIKVDQ